jgi:hypothetical protein
MERLIKGRESHPRLPRYEAGFVTVSDGTSVTSTNPKAASRSFKMCALSKQQMQGSWFGEVTKTHKWNWKTEKEKTNCKICAEMGNIMLKNIHININKNVVWIYLAWDWDQ